MLLTAGVVQRAYVAVNTAKLFYQILLHYSSSRNTLYYPKGNGFKHHNGYLKVLLRCDFHSNTSLRKKYLFQSTHRVQKILAIKQFQCSPS